MQIVKQGLKGLIILLVSLSGCTTDPATYKAAVEDPELYRQTVKNLTDIIVYDIFSPPVASRIYAYPSIAAYEVMAQVDTRYQSLAGQVNDLTPIPTPSGEVSYPIAAMQAFIATGRKFIFSEERMYAYEAEVEKRYAEAGVPSSLVKASMAYGEQVAEHILAWSKGDNYHETRTFPRYTVTETNGRWTPTPPDYMDAIEPHWNQMRPFIIDSATQFAPIPPPAYSMDQGSKFYQDLMFVYETAQNLDEEQKEIAQFWDCNPFVSHHKGHVMFATKKITPGGHWVGITDITTRKAGDDFVETIHTYMRVSIALADAFISCWDEKYRSNLIRPETVINAHMDPDWAPLLQTPPFPEYTSGHSVISSAAAIALTDIYGDNFAFVDSTEVEYGLPARKFDSFLDASSEAAISRLYGGIHYMPAIDEGVAQGQKVGHYVVKNLKTYVGEALATQQD